MNKNKTTKQYICTLTKSYHALQIAHHMNRSWIAFWKKTIACGVVCTLSAVSKTSVACGVVCRVSAVPKVNKPLASVELLVISSDLLPRGPL